MRRFAIGEAISLTTWAILPSGLRTATAQLDGRAHHHALEDGLAADRRAHADSELRLAAAAFSSLRWKRSTRPPVSTSFCLPV